MATERREERIKKSKQMKICIYSVMLGLVLVGFIFGFITGRATAPEKVYDIPLSHGLQNYIFELCADENVPATLVFALIEHESQFNPEVISNTNDYGLMQINEINHSQFVKDYRSADMLNPYQNVYCGIKILSNYIDKFDGDYTKALMAYNMGEYGAKNALDIGITSTDYSTSVLDIMNEYEEAQND